MLLLLLPMICWSCGQSTMGADQEKLTTKEKVVADGLFLHIKSADAHQVLMAMKMATLMAEDKDVLIYMDIDAAKLPVKQAKPLEMEGFESFNTYLNMLKEKQVTVYVCPTCLKVAGFSEQDLLEGVTLANKEGFFNFTQGRILTLDY